MCELFLSSLRCLSSQTNTFFLAKKPRYLLAYFKSPKLFLHNVPSSALVVDIWLFWTVLFTFVSDSSVVVAVVVVTVVVDVGATFWPEW